MASSPKLTFLLFLLLALQTHARDSQFFSRVTRNRDDAPSTTTTTSIPTTTEVSSLNKKEKQEPTFTPQNTEGGYGLYGHETGLDPPSSTSTTTSLYSMDENDKKNYATELKGLSVNGFTNEAPADKFKNYGVEMYYQQGAGLNGGVEKQGISGKNNYYYKENEGAGYYGGEEKHGSRAKNNYYRENEGAGYYGVEEKQAINDNNNYYYRENEGVGYYGGEEKQGMSAKSNHHYKGNEGAGYYGGLEKQGMSDTRFLENGKYYHDTNAEQKYDSNPNYIPYKGNHYNSNYENNYNNYNEYYNNNYENSKQKYQNQEQEEEEFDFDP